jgi:glycosyltransferase involved in cell wall biosynthesis
MPTFNRPQFLPKAVQAILDQDYDNWELLIQDGGSQHAALPSDPRVKHFIEPDTGITNALNKGVDKTLGVRGVSDHVYNWSNDDDLMAPGTLRWVSENMDDAMWLYGNIKMQGQGRSFVYGWPWDWEKHKVSNLVPQPSAFWNSTAFRVVGWFDESCDLTSDFEFWCRLGSAWTPKYTDRIMAYYTLHPDQITQTRRPEQIAQHNATVEKYK